MEYVACPFCGDEGFDLIGLKYHLENYCKSFAVTLTPNEEAALLDIKRKHEEVIGEDDE